MTIEEFFQKISIYTKEEYFQNFGEIENFLMYTEAYLQRVSEAEKQTVLKNMAQSVLYAPEWMKIHIYSFCMKVSDTSDYTEQILDAVNAADFENMVEFEKIGYFWCVLEATFSNAKLETAKTDVKLAKLYFSIYKQFEKALGVNGRNYIPIGERNKGFVIMFTSQFLGEEHAPTKTVLDRCYVLQKYMQKKVLIINTAMQFPRNAVAPFYKLCDAGYREEYLEKHEIQFKDQTFSFIQCENNMPDIEKIKEIMLLVQKERPGYILNVGGCDFCADLCGTIVPEITISTVFSKVSYSAGEYQIVDKQIKEQDRDVLRQLQVDRDKVYQTKFTFTFKEQRLHFEREELGFDQEDFVAAIIGWRLDEEINEEFWNLLQAVTKQNENFRIAVIGKLDSYEKVIQTYPTLRDRCINLGKQSDVLAILEHCDLYLNPKRNGGGSSASEALYQGVPVLSLPYGDVSVAAGEDFLVESYEQMQEFILKYCSDKDFYREMSYKAKKQASRLLDSKTYFGEVIEKIEERIFSDWKSDCYFVGKYRDVLQKTNVFNDGVTTIIESAKEENRLETTLQYLESMISQSEEFYKVEQAVRPVLIYKGDPVCHNVLTVIAEQIGKALEEKGLEVLYFDLDKEPPEAAIRYMHQHFRAIIGVQSYMFSIKMKDEIHYLHEYIHGPKYNLIFDHPIWMQPHLVHNVPDFHVLTHDEDYVAFIKKYNQKDAEFFPIAGMVAETKKIQQKDEVAATDRMYDLSFVGTYSGYMGVVLEMHQWERKKRFLANKFLLYMRKNPNETSENALQIVLENANITLTQEDFLKTMYEMRTMIYCVKSYYRDRILRKILEAGIRLDVFGDSWENCPLVSYPNLICHPNVTIEESLEVWQKSKLSLNIMSWHKAGFTERMAGIMLADAVLVTDNTRYLKGRYSNDDMVIFDLEHLEDLPEKIFTVLNDEEKRTKVAKNGREITVREHTWEKRALQLVEILEKSEGTE